MRDAQSQRFALIRDLSDADTTLARQFPRLAAVLDQDAFHDLVRGYMTAYPSRNPSLRFVGERLACWLAHEYDPLWLAELAALEYARLDVFDEIDENLLTVDDLRRSDRLTDVSVRLVRAHRLVPVAHAVEAIWRGETDDPQEAPGMLLVWRCGVKVSHRRMGALEQAALARTAERIRIGALCERMADAETAFKLLQTWTADGLLAA
jgi:hypothetical protein